MVLENSKNTCKTVKLYYLTSRTTSNSKEIKYIRLDTIKLLEENIGKKQCLGSDFFNNMTPKGQTIKTKIKNVTTSKSEVSV